MTSVSSLLVEDGSGSIGSAAGSADGTLFSSSKFLEGLQKRASLTSPRTEEAPSLLLNAADCHQQTSHHREHRASSLASPFSFAGSLWTCSSSESIGEQQQQQQHQHQQQAGGAFGTAASAATAALLDWSTPTPTIENTPRRASLASTASWKCVGSLSNSAGDGEASSAATATASLSGLLPSLSLSLSGMRQRSASLSSFPSHSSSAASASASALNGVGQEASLEEEGALTLTLTSSAVDAATATTTTSSKHQLDDLDPVEEAVELFKRTSMESLLDFPISSSGGNGTSVSTSTFSSASASASTAAAFSQSILLSGFSGTATSATGGQQQRRHSVNWLTSKTVSLDGHSSLFDDLTFPAASTGIVSEEQQQQEQHQQQEFPSSSSSSSLPSSPEFDTFPEDFTAPTTGNFSKKRFARRHSIATDMALEESFATALSFDAIGSGSGAAVGINDNVNTINVNVGGGGGGGAFGAQSASAANAAALGYPFNGNVMAAYSGLLQNELTSLMTMDQQQQQQQSVHSIAAAAQSETIFASMLKYSSPPSAIVAPPTTLTPAAAGIAPTALSFPHATFHLAAHKGPLYLIEFKAGRTEIFYVLDADVALSVKVGDLVIVEADRGEDLGRITGEMSSARIRQLIAQLPQDSLSSALASQFDDSVAANGANVNHNLAGLKDFEIAALIASKEICPKRIHRLATPLDVRFLQAKAQEEALAMVRCQARIKQKKLPMDVVDAEYQWDRNKLTFYFAAERRIDFRELVRDLFRIYKTRIWMCAVDKNRAALLNSIAATYK